jgi:hypothetical protein
MNETQIEPTVERPAPQSKSKLAGKIPGRFV